MSKPVIPHTVKVQSGQLKECKIQSQTGFTENPAAIWDSKQQAENRHLKKRCNNAFERMVAIAKLPLVFTLWDQGKEA